MNPNLKIKISRDGIEIGEEELQHIEQKLKAGVIKITDHYWHEGMTQWEPLPKLIEQIEQARKDASIIKAKLDADKAKRDAEIAKVKREERVDSFILFLNESVKTLSALFIYLFIGLLYLCGFFIFLDGLFSSPDGSAIRQGVLEMKSVKGLLMMILGTMIYKSSSFTIKK
jgi:hypothetical protein